jgi:hypothetical protein
MKSAKRCLSRRVRAWSADVERRDPRGCGSPRRFAGPRALPLLVSRGGPPDIGARSNESVVCRAGSGDRESFATPTRGPTSRWFTASMIRSSSDQSDASGPHDWVCRGSNAPPECKERTPPAARRCRKTLVVGIRRQLSTRARDLLPGRCSSTGEGPPTHQVSVGSFDALGSAPPFKIMFRQDSVTR